MRGKEGTDRREGMAGLGNLEGMEAENNHS